MAEFEYSSNPEIDEILTRAVDGEALAGGDILQLMEEADVHSLGRAAHDLRLHRCPADRVTYVIDRNINYSNICYVNCTFCAFYRHKNDDGAYVLSYEKIYEKIEELVAIGGTQILLQGGHHPNLKLDWYQGLLSGIKERYPIHVHGFSPSEIAHFSKVFKMPTTTVLRELQAAGLDSVPGGGAEILTDRVRDELAPTKVGAERWLGIMEEAHELGMKTSATMMFGHVESLPERVEHLLRVRESQARTGGFTAFIPAPREPASAHRTGSDLSGKLGNLPRLSGSLVQDPIRRRRLRQPWLSSARPPVASSTSVEGSGMGMVAQTLYTTHDQRIFPFADWVLWLDNGQVVEKQKRGSASPAGLAAAEA